MSSAGSDDRDGIAVHPQRHESTLGQWVRATCQPHQLGGLVDALWYFEGSVTQRRERIFPDGRIELNVHIGAHYREIRGDTSDAFPTVCVSGLLQRTTVVEAPPEPTAVLGIRLLPAGAARLLGHPVHELTGITVDLHDLVADAAAELLDRCASSVGAEARLAAAVGWLDERAALGAARQGRLDEAVAWAAHEIERRRGALSIAELRQRTGWSKSRFTTAFRERVGVSPKRLARILRFRRALELVHGGGLSLSRIALRTGYYDQAHFNGEFRELAGASPREYLASRRYPDSLNLVEP